VPSQEKFDGFFKALGLRLKELRRSAGYTQEDMLSFGFSTRHWQQIEAGRPVTLTTVLRACGVFHITPESLLEGLYGPSPNSSNDL
jgi:transcriptional regulator with XRE-family HTH domain